MAAIQNICSPTSPLPLAARPKLLGDPYELSDGRVRVRHPDGWWVDLPALPARVLTALRRLDGLRSLDLVGCELRAKERALLDECLRALGGVRLVQNSPTPLMGHVVVLGEGRLARSIVEAVRPVCAEVTTDQWRDGGVVGTGPFAPGSARTPLARVRLLGHWGELAVGSADLVIVAPATSEADRALTDHLARHHLPHLMVRAHRGLATLGPLVADASPTCLRCHDLTLSQGDPDWPEELLRLAGLPAEPAEAMVRWASAGVALRAAWFLAGRSSDLFGATLEASIDRPGELRRVWPTYPDCECRFDPAQRSPALPALQAA